MTRRVYCHSLWTRSEASATYQRCHLLQSFHWVQILQKRDSNRKQRAEEGRRESMAVTGPDTCWRLAAAVRSWRTACTKTPRRPVAAQDPPRAESIAWCGGQIPTPWIRSCWNMARKNKGRADGTKFKFPPLILWWGTEKQTVYFL